MKMTEEKKVVIDQITFNLWVISTQVLEQLTEFTSRLPNRVYKPAPLLSLQNIADENYGNAEETKFTKYQFIFCREQDESKYNL